MKVPSAWKNVSTELTAIINIKKGVYDSSIRFALLNKRIAVLQKGELRLASTLDSPPTVQLPRYQAEKLDVWPLPSLEIPTLKKFQKIQATSSVLWGIELHEIFVEVLLPVFRIGGGILELTILNGELLVGLALESVFQKG